ncbi:hypothetical protein ACFPYM_04915 [Methylobacterium hispanicum]|uniref:hypothetical protein n=1 Tax=Methylobacterium hispanicum TaxID=270350 RepID=UPI001EE06B9C|nr:hypothetical protein [Methylobacterium hispanicum]
MSENCTYIDGLMIDNPQTLTILSLLYDKISLPHPYDHDPNCEEIMRISFDNEGYREIERRWYRDWKKSNKELFDAGVLDVLPAPIAAQSLPRDIESMICLKLGPNKRRISTSDVLEGRVAIAMHALYAEGTPQISRLPKKVGPPLLGLDLPS